MIFELNLTRPRYSKGQGTSKHRNSYSERQEGQGKSGDVVATQKIPSDSRVFTVMIAYVWVAELRVGLFVLCGMVTLSLGALHTVGHSTQALRTGTCL